MRLRPQLTAPSPSASPAPSPASPLRMNTSDQFRLPFLALLTEAVPGEGYTWFEAHWDAAAGEYVTPPSPRSGVGTAHEINGQPAVVPTYRTLRYRDAAPGTGVHRYEFDVGASSCPVTSVTNVCPVIEGGVVTGITVEYTTRVGCDVVDRYCVTSPTGCCDPEVPPGTVCPCFGVGPGEYCFVLSGMSDGDPGTTIGVVCSELNRVFNLTAFAVSGDTDACWYRCEEATTGGPLVRAYLRVVAGSARLTIHLGGTIGSAYASYALAGDFDCEAGGVFAVDESSGVPCDGWPATITVGVRPCEDPPDPPPDGCDPSKTYCVTPTTFAYTQFNTLFSPGFSHIDSGGRCVFLAYIGPGPNISITVTGPAAATLKVFSTDLLELDLSLRNVATYTASAWDPATGGTFTRVSGTDLTANATLVISVSPCAACGCDEGDSWCLSGEFGATLVEATLTYDADCVWTSGAFSCCEAVDMVADLEIASGGVATLVMTASSISSTATYTKTGFDCATSNTLTRVGSGSGACGWPATVTLAPGAC